MFISSWVIFLDVDLMGWRNNNVVYNILQVWKSDDSSIVFSFLLQYFIVFSRYAENYQN